MFLLIYNASLIMLIIKLSNVITVATFIQLTSISGGRFEPPTVFAVRLVSIVTYLSGFVKCLFDRLTNRVRRDIIKITKEAHCDKRFSSNRVLIKK